MATVHRHSFTRLTASEQNDEQFYLKYEDDTTAYVDRRH
jgi:hypothetical protein